MSPPVQIVVQNDQTVRFHRRNVKFGLWMNGFMLVMYLLTILPTLFADFYKDDKSELEVLNNVIGVVLVVFEIAMTYMQADVAFRMRLCCDLRRIPAAYAKHVSFWKYVSLGFIVVVAIGYVVAPSWIGPCLIIFRLIGIYVLREFTRYQIRDINAENERSRVMLNTINERIRVSG